MLNPQSLQDPTDAIFMYQEITPEDKAMVQEIYDKNMAKIDKKLNKQNLLSQVEENEMVAKVDYAIKSILQHIVNGRGAE